MPTSGSAQADAPTVNRSTRASARIAYISGPVGSCSLATSRPRSAGERIHHPSRDSRQLRRRRLHALDRLAGRDERARARRQRVRRGCGQGPAPALAAPALFRRVGLDLVPGIGLMPATVPGAFGAWATLLRDHGTWPLADVLRPAIEYARDGFPLVPRIVEAIMAVRPLFAGEWTDSAAIWLPRGRGPAPRGGLAHRRP